MLRLSCSSASQAHALSTRPALATSAIIVPAMRRRRLSCENQALARALSLRARRFGRKSITGAMDRVQQFHGEVAVDCRAQRVHVRTQEVSFGRIVAP